MAFAATETPAPAKSSAHGYHAARELARTTTATVATTMIPSTISGHAQDCPVLMPDRCARSARDVKDSQNAPAAINTVPATAVAVAMRMPSGSDGLMAGTVLIPGAGLGPRGWRTS